MVGNIPNYNHEDMLRALFLLKRFLSRQELSSRLELGEGSVRSILSELKRRKLIVPAQQGHHVSMQGKRFLDKLGFSEPRRLSLKVFRRHSQTGTVVRNVSKKINYLQRDIALRHGAEGALLFKYKNKLFLPQAEQASLDTGALEKLFSFRNNDVLIVAFAKSRRVAENSALAVAIALKGRTTAIQ